MKKPRPVLEKKKQGVDLEKRGVSLSAKTAKSLARVPALETLFEDEGDPLEDVEYNDADLERSADAEMSEILRQIKERRQADRDRFRVARDPDYFLVLCFQSHEQRDEFLTKSGWGKADNRYLNGLEIARRLGINVEPIEIKPLGFRGRPKKYSKLEVL